MELRYSFDEIDVTAKKIIDLFGEKKLVAFYGNMGAGKTTLIKSICKQLGVTENISSPTYSIIQQYKTGDEKIIYHIDLYRLKDRDEVMDAGVDETIFSGEYCFIEWPENFYADLPADTIKIDIDILSDTGRKIMCKDL